MPDSMTLKIEMTSAVSILERSTTLHKTVLLSIHRLNNNKLLFLFMGGGGSMFVDSQNFAGLQELNVNFCVKVNHEIHDHLTTANNDDSTAFLKNV